MAGELQRRVGMNLRAHRRRLGLSQEAFAFEIGVHRTYMGGIERGDRNMTLLVLQRVAEQMGVDPWELLRPLDEDDPLIDPPAADGDTPAQDRERSIDEEWAEGGWKLGQGS